jgi:uncharacterized protein YdhG (YjbR/CyaY superfamily)
MDAKAAAAADIDEYIAAQPVAVRPILQRIRAIVREAAPDARESISYRMPAFMRNGVLIYFAAFKNHIGIYPPVHGNAALLEALAPYRGEKGNLAFALAQAMPYALIRRVVLQRAAENAAKAHGRRAKSPPP